MLELRLGIEEAERERAAALYLEAFDAKLGPILGRDGRARAFMAGALRPAHVIAARRGGRLIGLAGVHGAEGGFIGGELADMRRAYGPFGGLWRGLALSLFERSPAEGELLMDGVVVAAEARGAGVGSALLEAVADHAREIGARQIRLDVVDSNPRARALYERRGFEAVAQESAWPIGPIFGFNRSTTMIRRVAPTP